MRACRPKDRKSAPARGGEREREKEKQRRHVGGGWRERAHTCGEERKRERFGSSFYMFFPPSGHALCKSGQPGVLFVLPEVLTLVLGRSFDLPLFYFRGLFPSLSFSHRHLGLLFPVYLPNRSKPCRGLVNYKIILTFLLQEGL